MKKKIVISAIVLAGICVLLGIGYMVLCWVFFGTPWELADVKKEAQQYLNEKYSNEMIVYDAEKSPGMGVYTVYSYRKMPRINFAVEVALDHSDITDDYYKRYFEEQVSDSFNQYVNTIYENSTGYVLFDYSMEGLLDEEVKNGIINESTLLESTDIFQRDSIKYGIIITDKLKISDSSKIYEIVNHIFCKGYDVMSISFSFKDGNLLYFWESDFKNIVDSDSIVPYINEAIADKEN